MLRTAILLTVATATTACHAQGRSPPSPAQDMLSCATTRAMGAGFQEYGRTSVSGVTLVRRAGSGAVEDVLQVSATDSTLSVHATAWVRGGPPPKPDVMHLAAQIQRDCSG